MKGLSRTKFSSCRQQFLAASHARAGHHSISATTPWRRTFNLPRSHSSLPAFSLIDRFCFRFGLAVCL